MAWDLDEESIECLTNSLTYRKFLWSEIWQQVINDILMRQQVQLLLPFILLTLFNHLFTLLRTIIFTILGNSPKEQIIINLNIQPDLFDRIDLTDSLYNFLIDQLFSLFRWVLIKQCCLDTLVDDVSQFYPIAQLVDVWQDGNYLA